MRASAPFLLAAVALAAPLPAADVPSPAPPAAAAPLLDPDIREIVAAISPERIQRTIYVLASFKTRHTLSDPLASGDDIGGSMAWIRAEFNRVSAQAGGRLKVELDAFEQPPAPPRNPDVAQVTNIVATLPGADPDSEGRILVVCAHYDSRVTNPADAASPAPGADDDASGTAAVLELARVLSHFKFAATIVFAAFSGEEQGLFGSTHWAQGAKAGHADIEAVLNDDTIGSSRSETGRIDRGTVRLFAQGVPPTPEPAESLVAMLKAGGENDTPPRELARAIREIAASYVPSMKVEMIYRADRYLRGGDQLPFLDRGYAAVRFTEPAEDFRHQHQDTREENGVQYGDTPDHLDFAYAADVARVNAAALAVLARAPAPPRAVQIEAARLENDTTLRWAPNSGQGLAGYRIVWRESTSPYWEHGMDVGRDVTRATVRGVSKDNAVFGLEAFDDAGHFSPAVFPKARKAL
ncbi:MAG TPA: M20/M25/M40 family metallo-hydrolase [Opitutaceae bacterium]|nr:M20/M25/M40 family metallo-hydrolase [Opitutaceae bacterium]